MPDQKMFVDAEIERTSGDVFLALKRLNAYNESLHRAFVYAAALAAVSTAACVAFAIDKWFKPEKVWTLFNQ